MKQPITKGSDKRFFINSRRAARHVAVAAAFVCSLLAYLLTLEPDASYWDCPEYLTTAARLEIGHPPGNPTWTLTARIFALFGGASARGIAIAVNASSAIFTALAVALLASIIFIILTRLRLPSAARTPRSAWLRALCAWSGATCFGWCDSAWFSAIEAEVYAMSLFLTALVVRLMIGWMMIASGARSRRRLLLIVYLTGLSIGVHQLNLLVIPALALIWLFRRRPQRAGWWRILLALLLGCAAVGLILLGMMPGVIKVASQIELYCVNALRLPLHSGVWLFWILAILIFWSLPFSISSFAGAPRSTAAARRLARLEVIAWIPALLLIGFSSYMLILVRGHANPPMNEGAPSTIFALQRYLGRDQYGSTPLFYGRTPYSRILRVEEIRPDGTPDYSRNALVDADPHYAYTDSGYVLYEHSRRPILTPELNMWLPRLTSSDPSDIRAYSDWAGMDSSTMTEVEVSYALDSLGNPVGRLLDDGSRVKDKELRPTYLQQLRYLFGYQIGYMYFRYLLWNFSGRQNDRFAVGEAEQGNFITGVPPIDNLMLGPQEAMPDEIGKRNPGHNVYFMIPLIIAIVGMVALQKRGRRGRRWNLILTVLFLMTGVAIVVYLNQSPGEPRERDYSFLGSFWTFCIWIAAGMAWLCMKGLRSRRSRVWLPAAAIFTSLLPIWMLYQNYDDHDRSRRTAVTDFATNLLESLEPEAILFTNGDNFTFPLWWAQEVVGVRPDVRIINLAYLSTPWYIEQLMTDMPQSKGLRMMMPLDELRLGGFKFNAVTPRPNPVTAADSLSAPDALRALREYYGAPAGERTLPPLMRMANPLTGDSLIIYTSEMAGGSRRLTLRQLAMLDIIVSNTLPPSNLSSYDGSNPQPRYSAPTNHAHPHSRPVYWQSATRAADYGAFLPLTTRVLHSRRLIYRDSLGNPDSDPLARQLLDHDWQQALLTRSGRSVKAASAHNSNSGRSEKAEENDPAATTPEVYADDTYGYMLTTQRQALLRFGGRLLKAGRKADALRLAHLIDSLYPARIHEYRIYAESDSLIDEGSDLARLYMEGAPRKGDVDYRRGLQLLGRERRRYAQWEAFRTALPPRLRRVLSPKNLRNTRRLPAVDSLLLHYRN